MGMQKATINILVIVAIVFGSLTSINAIYDPVNEVFIDRNLEGWHRLEFETESRDRVSIVSPALIDLIEARFNDDLGLSSGVQVPSSEIGILREGRKQAGYSASAVRGAVGDLLGQSELTSLKPGDAFLSEEAAKGLFGHDGVVGETLTVTISGERHSLTIQGLLESRDQSHLSNDVVFHESLVRNVWRGAYNNPFFANSFYYYVQASPDILEEITEFVNELYLRESGSRSERRYIFFPADSIYLNPASFGEHGPRGSRDVTHLNIAVGVVSIFGLFGVLVAISILFPMQRLEEARLYLQLGGSYARLVPLFSGQPVVLGVVSFLLMFLIGGLYSTVELTFFSLFAVLGIALIAGAIWFFIVWVDRSGVDELNDHQFQRGIERLVFPLAVFQASVFAAVIVVAIGSSWYLHKAAEPFRSLSLESLYVVEDLSLDEIGDRWNAIQAEIPSSRVAVVDIQPFEGLNFQATSLRVNGGDPVSGSVGVVYFHGQFPEIVENSFDDDKTQNGVVSRRVAFANRELLSRLGMSEGDLRDSLISFSGFSGTSEVRLVGLIDSKRYLRQSHLEDPVLFVRGGFESSSVSLLIRSLTMNSDQIANSLGKVLRIDDLRVLTANQVFRGKNESVIRLQESTMGAGLAISFNSILLIVLFFGMVREIRCSEFTTLRYLGSSLSQDGLELLRPYLVPLGSGALVGVGAGLIGLHVLGGLKVGFSIGFFGLLVFFVLFVLMLGLAMVVSGFARVSDSLES